MHDGSMLLMQQSLHDGGFQAKMTRSTLLEEAKSFSPPAPLVRRRSSVVRNLCRETRFEAQPVNFSRPLFVPSLTEHRLDGCKSVQLASVCFAMQSFVGQIICPNAKRSRTPSSPLTPTMVARSKASAPPQLSSHRCHSANTDDAPQRRVFVRYTVNNWQSYVDTDATFTSVYSSDGKTSWSTFSFKLDTSLDNPDEHTVHFAICSQTYSDDDDMIEEAWDDNDGQNYIVLMKHQPNSPVIDR